MINTEKLLLELDDIKNDIEKRLIIIENSTMYLGSKDLDKSKQIAKLEVINKVIDIASRLDEEGLWSIFNLQINIHALQQRLLT